MITEIAYGIIPVLRQQGKEDRFLLLKQFDNHWSFPKGHKEANEDPLETALRELKEEADISDIQLADLPSIVEEYDFERNGETRHKINEYFIAFVKDDHVITQSQEILECMWVDFETGIETFLTKTRKQTLEIARDYLRKQTSIF